MPLKTKVNRGKNPLKQTVAFLRFEIDCKYNLHLLDFVYFFYTLFKSLFTRDTVLFHLLIKRWTADTQPPSRLLLVKARLAQDPDDHVLFHRRQHTARG